MLQWKHPGLQLRWSQVRTPLPEPPEPDQAERRLGQSDVPLWELLLDTLSAHTGSIKFIKVPSHVDILGNNEADRLADQGRLSHPRCPVLKTPSRDYIMPTYTPPTKRRRRTTAAELDSIVQVLNFSPHKDNMGGSVV